MLFSPPDLSVMCLWMLFAQWDISATDELVGHMDLEAFPPS